MIDTPDSIYNAEWSGWKSDYKALETALRFKFIANLVAELKPKVILDLGCGSGYLAQLIKLKCPEIIIHGLDISEIALEKAKQLDIKYQLNLDKKDIPQKDEFFDVVICSEILEHLFDVKHSLTEIYRVLKKDGTGIITVPNFGYWRFRIDSLFGKVPSILSDPRHLHTFNINLLKKQVEEVGFKVYRITGLRQKCRFLNKISVSLFSDTIVFQSLKA